MQRKFKKVYSKLGFIMLTKNVYMSKNGKNGACLKNLFMTKTRLQSFYTSKNNFMKK